ncbi:hypothetical protein DL770_002094 [Monosporascus sp. CRB-9-2]|nr:hypothetical protein DL770_002094 [Monosporascus sp. CRB-9-2]
MGDNPVLKVSIAKINKTTPIPQPPGAPLLQNIFDIDSSNTWECPKILAENYGEIFQIKVLGKTVIFVAGAALSEKLYDEKCFRRFFPGRGRIIEIRYGVGDSLVAAFDHQESWGVAHRIIAHRIIAPQLCRDAVAGMFDEMRDITVELNAVGGLREPLRLSLAAPRFNVEPVPHGGDGADDASPVLLGGGRYAVAHDQAMVVVLAGVNRDPAVFADLLAFDPGCMTGEVFERLPRAARRYFGNGKHGCEGKHWAWQFSLVVLTLLLREVSFEKADPAYELQA